MFPANNQNTAVAVRRNGLRRRSLRAGVSLLFAAAATTQPGISQQSTAAQQTGPTSSSATGRVSVSAAQTAYLTGARLLGRDELEPAEREFARAVQLDPKNPEYTVALQLAREHRVTSLIQLAGQARLKGDIPRSDSLLAQARAIDPENPLVLEHAPQRSLEASASLPAQPVSTTSAPQSTVITPAGSTLPAPVLAGAIQLRPSVGPAALHLAGDSRDVLSQIASAYGLRVIFDDSLEHKSMRFDMDSATYADAMAIGLQMARAFAVPVDESTVLIAKDDPSDRDRLEPVLEETIYLPGMSTEQVTDIANVIRSIFGITRASVQTTLGAVVVRAPGSVLEPMNVTLQQFIDSGSDVMFDVKLYELDLTRTRNIGATLPTQAGIYSVEGEATNLVNSNQTLVQQAIAQGYISSTASNLQIALALIGSGLVQSSLLSSTIGFFGNGLSLAGITETGSIGFNLGFNQSETRILDDLQMHVGDRQAATFRAGTRYPITTSTYTTGISTAASALSSATINGVSVASLLAQYSGGTSTTIPQIQYEDLGLTLKTTPNIERSGRIFMALDLKIEALSGTSLDGNPVLNSRQFASSISVGDGETAMLVSNLNRSETIAVSGLPGLAELPGFQIPLDQNAETDTSQLVVLITPHVIRRRMNPLAGPEMIVHVSNREAGATPAEPQAPPGAPAAPPGAAPGSEPGTPPAGAPQNPAVPAGAPTAAPTQPPTPQTPSTAPAGPNAPAAPAPAAPNSGFPSAFPSPTN